jgi:hypothetical protein
MTDKKQSTKQEPPPTIITLTLPTPEGGGIAPERATATLLIQRGDLAHVRQFHYHGYLPDVMDAIREATEALGLLEDNPPVIPELPAEKPKPEPKQPKVVQMPPADEEPTIDIPLKKGTLAIKISYLKIVGGETDAAAYRQAVLIAGKLIDGKLWDGTFPIRIDDVYATMKKMKHLTDRDFSLFALEDFVQVGGAADTPQTIQVSDEDADELDNDGSETQPLLMTAPSLDEMTFSANGHQPDDADDE